MASERSTTWVFTINNYTEDECRRLEVMTDPGGDASYVTFGYELGDNATPHLQGYVEFRRRMRRSRLSRMDGLSRAYLAVRRGTQRAAIEYAQKEGDFYESGIPFAQGRRSDLDAIRTSIEEGATEREIARENFSKWVIYRRSFQRYRELVGSTPREWACSVEVFWGVTNTGKTRKVYDLARAASQDLYSWAPCARGAQAWFDGYSQQEWVLFDDYTGQIDFAFLLQLIDRYPLRVQVKGDFVNWAPKFIYFTSNLPWQDWYPDITEVQRDALKRRFTKITNFVQLY